MTEELSGAVISNDKIYRYHLHRTIDTEAIKGTLLFIMLNPSTADALEDDRTIRRCKGYALDWGFERLEVVNLFSFRATDPDELPIHFTPRRYGSEHQHYVDMAIQNANLIICGWGGSDFAYDGDEAADRMIQKIFDFQKIPYCLKINNDGSPSHPLYLKKTLKPILL
ncbi:MAG: DUF1643 domain-containing protein [Bacteroidia bacterium]|nr:DUF1643 domain-containing protein [Bacteroidia bacterium]